MFAYSTLSAEVILSRLFNRPLTGPEALTTVDEALAYYSLDRRLRRVREQIQSVLPR